MRNRYRRPGIYAAYQVFGSFGQAVSEEKIKKNDPSETRIAYGGHSFSGLRQIEQFLWRTFYPCCLPSFIHLGKRF